MDSVAKRSWEAKRNKAIKRLVEVWNKSGATEDEDEAVSMAADAITIAHIAAALEWEGRPPKEWFDVAQKAMDRLVVAWEKYDSTDDDPEAEEALNIALDSLVIAHTAATFSWASGPPQW
jgi:hypothetical protein